MHKKLFLTITISALASALLLIGCRQVSGEPVAPKESFSAGTVSQDTREVTMVITADEISKLDQLQGLLVAAVEIADPGGGLADTAHQTMFCEEALQIPETESVSALIALGYPEEVPEAPKRKETELLLKIVK